MFRKSNVDLRLLIEGDKAQWDAFVDQYAALIYSVIRKAFSPYIKQPQDWDLDEAFQEVFVRLLKDERRLLKAYDPAKSSLSTWLTIVTRSVAIDLLRKFPRKCQTLDQVEVPVAAGDADLFIPVDIPEHLLSGRQKLILELLFKKGLAVSQAADILGVDEQTIRSTKHKALQILREYFKKDF